MTRTKSRRLLLLLTASLLPIFAGCAAYGEFANSRYRKVVTNKGVPSVKFETDLRIAGAATEQLQMEVTLLDRDGRPLRSGNGRFQNRSGHVAAGRALVAPGGEGTYTNEYVLLPVSEVEVPERRPPAFARFAVYDLLGALIVQHDIPFRLRPSDYERARQIEEYFSENETEPPFEEPRTRESEPADRDAYAEPPAREPQEPAYDEPPSQPPPDRYDERPTGRETYPPIENREPNDRPSTSDSLEDANPEAADTAAARRNRAAIQARAQTSPNEPAEPRRAAQNAPRDPFANGNRDRVPPRAAAGNSEQQVRDLQPLSNQQQRNVNPSTTNRYDGRRPIGPTGSQRSEPASTRVNTDFRETEAANQPKEKFQTYRVRKGETLSGIAQKMLGSATRWPEIYRLNEAVLDGPDFIPLGTELRIPAK